MQDVVSTDIVLIQMLPPKDTVLQQALLHLLNKNKAMMLMMVTTTKARNGKAFPELMSVICLLLSLPRNSSILPSNKRTADHATLLQPWKCSQPDLRRPEKTFSYPFNILLTATITIKDVMEVMVTSLTNSSLKMNWFLKTALPTPEKTVFAEPATPKNNLELTKSKISSKIITF
jgi:hypothetical protein